MSRLFQRRFFTLALLLCACTPLLASGTRPLFPTAAVAARVYLNPNTGRFWTMDSYEGSQSDPLTLHKYLYGADDPVNRIDPSGHFADAISLTTATKIAVGLAAFTGAAIFEAKTHALQNISKAVVRSIYDAIFATTVATASGMAVAKTVEEVKVEVDELVLSLGAAANNRIFVHATTSDKMPGLASGKGIALDPNRGGDPTGLEFGLGFYTFQLNDPNSAVSALESAVRWVSSPGHGFGVLAIFKMDQMTYEGLNKRQAMPFEPGLIRSTGFTGYDLVYGPLQAQSGSSWQYKFEGRGITELGKGFLAPVLLVK